jgi:ABC-type antimicrobial peptide transport system permease subunit
MLLNEAAVKFIGTKDPIGMEITRGEKKFNVVGVIKDVVMESPYTPVRHNIYTLDLKYQRANFINIKLNTVQSTSECLAAVESVLKKYAPSVPFDYKFADEEYGKKFKAEERIGTLALVFAGLATFISCLGLIGLASFVAERHTKEIGIRKVLGATIGQIWKLLSGNFVLLVIIASAIATPLSYYVMQMWLLRIPYHINMSWTLFAIIELAALGLTILTVSFQAIRAARANPVTSLRSE